MTEGVLADPQPVQTQRVLLGSTRPSGVSLRYTDAWVRPVVALVEPGVPPSCLSPGEEATVVALNKATNWDGVGLDSQLVFRPNSCIQSVLKRGGNGA